MNDSYSHYTRTADYYHRYRPHYPEGLLALLAAECGLTPGDPVADIGAGTGQMSGLFLRAGHPVYLVEPSQPMRHKAEVALASYDRLVSMAGTAEATGLPDHCARLIAVGNAFHWFDREKTRPEFERILQPGGWVVLAWNLERHDGTPFAEAFERFWQTHLDPSAHFVRDHNPHRPGYIDRFFAPNPVYGTTLDNPLDCDWEKLHGLVLSMLKAPRPGEAGYAAMTADLRAIFDAHQRRGLVQVQFDTVVEYGQLTSVS